MAHKLDKSAPAVSGLSENLEILAERIAQDLKEAERPCVITGTSLGSKPLIEAATNVVQALCGHHEQPRICLTLPSCNSFGLGLLGGGSIETAVDLAAGGKADTVIVLENDLSRHMDTERVSNLLEGAETVIVLDSIMTHTAEHAHIVLPAAAFAESSGTFVNNEGRAQRFYRAYVPKEKAVRDSWKWLRDLMVHGGGDEVPNWETLDELVGQIAGENDLFGPISEIVPGADFRVLGQKIPRQPHRYSGRTAIHAAESVHEHPPREDPDSALAFSMEGYSGQPPGSLITHYWAPYWNSVQAINTYQKKVGGSLRGGDPGRRLIEPPPKTKHRYFSDIPEAFRRRDGEFLIVPSYHIFGSEELSSQSASIREVIAGPYIAIHPEQIRHLMISHDGTLEIAFSNISYHLPVVANPSVPEGLALVPMGLDGLQWDGLPVWKKLARQ